MRPEFSGSGITGTGSRNSASGSESDLVRSSDSDEGTRSGLPLSSQPALLPSVHTLDDRARPVLPAPRGSEQALRIAIEHLGLSHRLDALSLIRLRRVSRDICTVLENDLRLDATDDRRKQIREALVFDLQSPDQERASSHGKIMHCTEHMSRNKARRTEQLATLMLWLSGLAHIHIPTFRPSRRPYWKHQRELVECIVMSSGWRTLDLKFSSLEPGVLGKKARDILAAVLKAQRSNRQVRLAFDACRFNGRDGELFQSFALENVMPDEVLFSNVQADRKASQHILTALACSRVEKLSLSGCNFNGVENRLQLLLGNPRLTTLTLVGNMLEMENFTRLAQCIHTHPSLREVVMHGMQFGGVALALLDTFVHSQTIEVMDLSGNYLHDGFASVLKSLLATPNSLCKLDLSGTCMDEQCAEVLRITLPVNRTLIELNVGRNRLSNLAFSGLINGLCTNTSLLCLYTGPKNDGPYYNGPCLSFSAVRTLCHFLGKNHTLDYLDLTGFDFDSDGKVTLAEQLRRRKTPLTLVCNRRTALREFRKSEFAGNGERHECFSYMYGSEAQEKLKATIEKNPVLRVSFV